MLRTLPEEKNSNKPDSLNEVVNAYYCTRNDATGSAPFFLLFYREPRLPIDQIIGLCHLLQRVRYPKYVEQWATAMKDAYEIVRRERGTNFTQKERERKSAHSSTLNPGDRVLVPVASHVLGGGGAKSVFFRQTQ